MNIVNVLEVLIQKNNENLLEQRNIVALSSQFYAGDNGSILAAIMQNKTKQRNTLL